MSKVAVVFWSGTGNTEAMADLVAQGARAAGATADIIQCGDFSADRIADYDAFAFGCPAMGDEELEEREIPDCVLKVVEFMNANVEDPWNGSVGDLIEEAAVEGVTTATFGKFLARHSVFMRLRGVTCSKKHTSAGQVITLEKVTREGSEGDEGCAQI